MLNISIIASDKIAIRILFSKLSKVPRKPAIHCLWPPYNKWSPHVVQKRIHEHKSDQDSDWNQLFQLVFTRPEAASCWLSLRLCNICSFVPLLIGIHCGEEYNYSTQLVKIVIWCPLWLWEERCKTWHIIASGWDRKSLMKESEILHYGKCRIQCLSSAEFLTIFVSVWKLWATLKQRHIEIGIFAI